MTINKGIYESKALGFNWKNFVKDILNLEFDGNVRSCAIALDMNPNYLHDLVYTPSKDAGIKTLTKIYHYAKQTGKDPEKYIFKLVR